MVVCEKFGRLSDGGEALLFTLKNENGMVVKLTNVAAAIVAIELDGADMVLGYDNAESYRGKQAYHGAVIGRVANRIENARFMLNGSECVLEPNLDDRHIIHGGKIGLDSKLFSAKALGESAVEFKTVLPDGEDGFPGNAEITVTYTLSRDNALTLNYRAVCDKDTAINFTNHSYFNLRGQGMGENSIYDHEMQIFADSYHLLAENGMVHGEERSVEGVMDFREPKRIGRDRDKNDEQLIRASGYDHNYVLKGDGRELIVAARVREPISGRVMEVSTNSPGILFYTGNFLDTNPIKGKPGRIYARREGFCLETNFPPNALNCPELPQPILRAGDVWDYTTEFKFSK